MSEQKNEAKVYSLTDYIKKYHGGVKAKFGQFFDKWPQNVTKYFNNESKWCVVVQDDSHSLHQIIRTKLFKSS